MSVLLTSIQAISDLNLQVMQAILAKEEEARKVTGSDTAALELASAVSDFYQICAAIDKNPSQMSVDERSEFGNYGLSLLDRIAYLVRQLELMDQRESVCLINASLAHWLVKHEVTIEELEGTADGFGWIVNGLSDQEELTSMCRIMDEVIESVAETIQLDEDRSSPWRPWRVINLNMGIAATRSLNTELMAETFDRLGRRLPYDMAGFLADGKRQMMVSNVPDEVVEVLNSYIEKWPTNPAH